MRTPVRGIRRIFLVSLVGREATEIRLLRFVVGRLGESLGLFCRVLYAVGRSGSRQHSSLEMDINFKIFRREFYISAIIVKTSFMGG